MTSLKKQGLTEYRDLVPSTQTVMVYSNMEFNLPVLYQHIPTYIIENPSVKKKSGEINRKDLKAPDGKVVFMHYRDNFRGMPLKNLKKYECIKCPKQTTKNDEGEYEEIISKNVEMSVYKLSGRFAYQHEYGTHYRCTECGTYFRLSQLKMIDGFLNQLTISISIGQRILHIMLFKDNFKIAGCKTDEQAIEASKILFRLINDVEGGWKIRTSDKPTFSTDTSKLFKNGTRPIFLFDTVMHNIGFRLSFNVDRTKLNQLLNSTEYKDVFKSKFESTGHTNVNVKMKTDTLETYTTLVVNDALEYVDLEGVSNPYKKKKKKKSKCATFIVFSSGQVILSGGNNKDMRENYNSFTDIIFKNKSLIEEKVEIVSETWEEFLKRELGIEAVTNKAWLTGSSANETTKKQRKPRKKKAVKT